MNRILTFTAAAAVALSLAACSGQKEDESTENSGQETVAEGYVYVPEFTELSSDLNISDPVLRGMELYYSSYVWDEASETGGYMFCFQNLETGEISELPFAFDLEEYSGWYPATGLIFDEEGNVFCLIKAYSYDENNSVEAWYLFQFDSEGNQILQRDITEALSLEDSDYSYIQSVTMDKEGKLYAVVGGSGNCFIVVIDAEGNTLARIDSNTDWVSAIGVTSDQKVLITRYSSTGGGMECVEVDVDGKTMGKTYSGMPSSYSNSTLSSTADGGLLVNDGSRLWKYDLEAESTEEILTWTDCNINGSYISMIQVLEDERIAVLSENWGNGTKEIAFLKKTEASQVEEKQLITIATLWSNSSLQEAVVNFNKQSDAYKVRIETYYDENSEWTENKYSDSIAALNNAITSSNCPDIIDLSYGNVDSWVSKGLLVDLAPYLEASSSVSREELVENVLEAYTYGDTLICIPKSFTISTIMGRTSQLGDRTSWTIRDIMEFAAEYPDAQLFYHSSKSSILQTCLQYSSDAFIDWENGTCSFDSQDFMDILEFANMFEEEMSYNEEDSFPKMISEGRILLNTISIYEITEMQMYCLMFNEPVTFIGYPTVDGSSGNRISGSDCYAITTRSENPDGAWAFIESLLQYEELPEWGMSEFSIRRDMLEEALAQAMEENVATDGNGVTILDENGDPIVYPKTTWGYDDWSAEIYAATEEQVQIVWDLIDSAKASVRNDETVVDMILEEAEAYFAGQKSAEEVAGVIQSRVQIYISENS